MAVIRDRTRGATALKSVQCPICKEGLDLFTHVHVAKHGLTKDEFLKLYPQFNSYGYWGTLRVIERCNEPGCSNGARYEGFCSKHATKNKQNKT